MLSGVSMGASSVFQPWELSEVRVLVAVLSCACVADAMLTPCGGGGGREHSGLSCPYFARSWGECSWLSCPYFDRSGGEHSGLSCPYLALRGEHSRLSCSYFGRS